MEKGLESGHDAQPMPSFQDAHAGCDAHLGVGRGLEIGCELMPFSQNAHAGCDAHLGVGRSLEIGCELVPFSQDTHAGSDAHLEAGGVSRVAAKLMLCFVSWMPMQSCCAVTCEDGERLGDPPVCLYLPMTS